jgi:hypothetical protein
MLTATCRLNIPIVPMAMPAFCPGASALCPARAMLFGGEQTCPVCWAVGPLVLVRRVVSTENPVIDRDDDPEIRQIILLEALWVLVLLSDVVDDSTVCVSELEGVSKLVDGVNTIDVILAVEDLRGGEIVDIEVVWKENGVVDEAVDEGGGGEGEGEFDNDDEDEDKDVDDDVSEEIVWLVGGTGATVAGNLLGGPF